MLHWEYISYIYLIALYAKWKEQKLVTLAGPLAYQTNCRIGRCSIDLLRLLQNHALCDWTQNLNLTVQFVVVNATDVKN